MIGTPKGQPQQAPQYEYNESDELDQKIATGLATTQILSPEGSQVVVKALSSKNPPKMLALFLAQIIEQAMTMSVSTDIPMSPVVWLSQGGAVDELGEIFQAVAEKNGINVNVEELMGAVKQELVGILQQRGQQLQGQMQQEGQMPPQGQPAGAQIGAPMQ